MHIQGSVIMSIRNQKLNISQKLGFDPNLTWDMDYHVYRFNGKPIIWIYWDKKTDIPVWIRLSLATLYVHNHKQFHIQIVNSSSIHDWVDDVHETFHYLTTNHQSDYFRTRILDTYGGKTKQCETAATEQSVTYNSPALKVGFQVVL